MVVYLRGPIPELFLSQQDTLVMVIKQRTQVCGTSFSAPFDLALRRPSGCNLPGPLRMTERLSLSFEASVRQATGRFSSRRPQPDAFALEAARPVRADKRPKAAE